MSITGQNSIINQFVPTFLFKNLADGQGIIYDSTKKAFVNSNAVYARTLGSLKFVDPAVDNVNTIPNGQALVFDTTTKLWTNQFIDYNNIINKPTTGNTFIGLSDTAKPSLPSGYVVWNSSGTQLVYTSTIPAGSISGLAQVATTGNFNDLSNKPTSSSYTLTGLADTNDTALANGILVWNSNGTQVDYLISIPAGKVSGLATVATTGNFNDLSNKPTSNSYTLTGLSDTTDVAVPNGILLWNSSGTLVVYTTTISTSQITGLSPVATSGNFNDLTNKPTSASYALSGLSDTNSTPLANGILIWNGVGTQVIYSTTLSSTQITGLATVATSGNFNDLTNKPTSASYALSGLSDTNSTPLANGFLKWNGSATEVIYQATIPASQITGLSPVAISGTLGSLTNVSPTTDTLNNTTDVNKTITWNGTSWIPSSIGGTLDIILPGTNGQIIYNNGGTWTTSPPNSTSGVQPYDAGLSALAIKTTTGLLTQTGNDTFTSVSLIAPATGITITNANGVAGNPTFALANDLAAIEGLTTTGLIVRTGDGTATTQSITGTAGRIVVSNGNGIAGAPTLDLATVTNSGTGTFQKLIVDTFGRTSGTTPVVASDITTLVDTTYVNVSGDIMTGTLTMSGGATITGVPTPVNPTDAANMAYVDTSVAGLVWKAAVLAGTTANITLSGTQTIDGIAVTVGNRVLVKNQTNQTQNGIYVVSAGAWTRSTDASTPAELDGAAVFIQQGNTVNDTGWVQTSTVVTIGVTNIVWVQFSGGASYTPGTGLTLTGNSFSVNMGAGIVELPSNNVGIRLFNTTTGALILTNDGTTRGTAIGTGLQLLLPAGSGLTQDITGLYVGNAAITNAKLANSSISTAGDTGTGAVSLGGTLTVNGTAAQGISTSAATGIVTITASNASSTQKGVASFNTTDFTVSTGAVVLNTVGVLKGGTGQTSFTAGQLLYGNGTSAISSSASLTFNGTTFVVNGLSIAGTSITGTTTNANINLLPNGTGSVVVGTAAAGRISADASQTLTITGPNGLTLASTVNNLAISLAASTTPKVRISGPTDAQYASGLTSVDLVNKYYVDSVAVSSSGSVKAVQATVSLATNTTTNIGSLLPINSTVTKVIISITATDTTANLAIGDGTTVGRYMPVGENDCSVVGIYVSDTLDKSAPTIQLVATVTGTSGAGSANVYVEYQLA